MYQEDDTQTSKLRMKKAAIQTAEEEYSQQRIVGRPSKWTTDAMILERQAGLDMEDCESKEPGFYSRFRCHPKYKTLSEPRGCGMIYICFEKISLAAGWRINQRAVRINRYHFRMLLQEPRWATDRNLGWAVEMGKKHIPLIPPPNFTTYSRQPVQFVNSHSQVREKTSGINKSTPERLNLPSAYYVSILETKIEAFMA